MSPPGSPHQWTCRVDVCTLGHSHGPVRGPTQRNILSRSWGTRKKEKHLTERRKREKWIYAFARWPDFCGKARWQPAWGHLSLSQSTNFRIITLVFLLLLFPHFPLPSHHLAPAAACFPLCQPWLAGGYKGDKFNSTDCVCVCVGLCVRRQEKDNVIVLG